MTEHKYVTLDIRAGIHVDIRVPVQILLSACD